MLGKLALPEVRELIEAGDFDTLRDVLKSWLPADLAALLSCLEPAERSRLFAVLNTHQAAETFEYLDLAFQQELLASLADSDAAAVLNEMAPDDRTALFEELPAETSARLMPLLSAEQQAVTRSLLSYGKNTIGRLMTPDYIAVKREWTVKHVLDHVRVHGKDSETLNVVYVTDNNNRLIDDVRIRDVLLAPLHEHVSSLMDERFVALSVTDDKRKAVDVFRKYDRTALPVVDSHGFLVGIVTIDDVLDVAEREATREIQRLGGLEALDEPYTATPLLVMVRKRASWLVILFLGELLTATAMGFYEDEIAQVVVLALFVPLIISSGGNSGSQAATLLVRALALREVRLRDWWRVLRREIASGILLGALLGSIGFLRISLWSAFSDIYGPHWLLIATTVAVSLVGVVTWGTLSGSMLPFLLKRLGFDPATSSAPLVATLVDVTGLVIYFSVAMLVLRGTLL
jgi:magnesium transporter